ncbi:hypothetical protein HDU98_007174 [Podochytrium sp. JEL0797]|nr:hypothetical protein HDU98_007174 [Podochytrium sp. JEL0797]
MKPPSLASLVSRLRTETGLGILAAKNALVQNNLDYAKALAFLHQQSAAKGAKLASRTTKQGLVAAFASSQHNSAFLLELNCETDFVQRSEDFQSALGDVVRVLDTKVPATTQQPSLLKTVLPDALKEWSLSQHVATGETVHERIQSTIAKLGENMTLRNCIVASSDSKEIQFGCYTHGGEDASMGKIAALVALRVSPVKEERRADIEKLAKQLAQQVVGFSPTVVSEGELSVDDRAKAADELDALVLNRQSFLMGGGSVVDVLGEFKTRNGLDVCEVVEFKRMVCGEGVEVAESNFKDEVMQQAGLKK